jgi:Ca2+-binding EF-hand superfamily protein
MTVEQRSELLKEFACNDKDRDGHIDFEEFRNLLEDLESEIVINDARIGFHAIDTDHDGIIDFNEFVAWWTTD